MIVGNLLTDPAAQSFISLADADAYLAPEQVLAWDTARSDQREAALVKASRWLVASFRFGALDDAGLAQVGRVAARLASESMTTPLFSGINTMKAIKSAAAGSASVTFRDDMRADAAGIAWPWLRPMLAGLIVSGSAVGVIVV